MGNDDLARLLGSQDLDSAISKSGEMIDLQAKLKGTTAVLKILSARVEALAKEVETLKKDAAGMSDIAGLKQDLAALDKAVHTSVVDLSKRVSALEKKK